MNSLKKYIALAAGALLAIAGCSVEYPSSSSGSLPRITTSGSADFTKFVTVGNSLTAGYQSGGLAGGFQVNSYPAQIARQLGIDDGGYQGSDFEQPLASDSGTTGILVLNPNPTGPIPTATPGTVPFVNTTLGRAYDNMAIPGAFVYDFTNATATGTDWGGAVLGSPNTLFTPVLRGLGTQAAQVTSLNPTFVIWWEGHNDILGYATRGAGVNGTPGASQGAPPYTPRSAGEATAFGMPGTFLFDNFYRAGITALRATGADIIVGNIPDVTAIPYFSTVYPSTTIYGPRPDSLVTGIVAGVTQKTRLYYQEDVVAPADSIQFLLLTVSSLIGRTTSTTGFTHPAPGFPYGLHPNAKIQGRYTLTFTEVLNIQGIITDYNNMIDSIATNRGIPVVDFKSYFNTIKASGYTLPNGSVANASFLAGGIFSLDGVHPSTLGYSIVANKWIEGINAAFNSDIPLINVNNYLNVK